MRVSVFVSMRTHMRIPWWRVYPISGFNFSISCMTHSAISTCMSLITRLCAWVEVISYKFAKRKRISSAVCSRLPLWMQLPMFERKVFAIYLERFCLWILCSYWSKFTVQANDDKNINKYIWTHNTPPPPPPSLPPPSSSSSFLFFLRVLTWRSPSLFRFG